MTDKNSTLAMLYGGPHDGDGLYLDKVTDTLEFEIMAGGSDFVPQSYEGHEELTTAHAAGMHHTYILSKHFKRDKKAIFIYDGVDVG